MFDKQGDSKGGMTMNKGLIPEEATLERERNPGR